MDQSRDLTIVTPALPAAPEPAAPLQPQFPETPYTAEEESRRSFPLDRLIHAWQAQLTGGISPAALMQAWSDWAIHLASQPGKQAALVEKAARKWVRFIDFGLRSLAGGTVAPAIAPLPDDSRFAAPDWQSPPFYALYQGFLLTQQWWHNATTGVRGVEPQHANIVNFLGRQALDAVSPSNFPATNPEVLRTTREQGGANLLRGWRNWIEDAERAALGKRPAGADAFQPGRNVAVTPGRVVYRNRLIEVIQYAPMTAKVQAEPVLIVPAWIMKYYILDLSPENSLVRWLVERGHTVFMISWVNPGERDRDMGMDDYLNHGVLKAVDVVRSIVPGRPRVHAVGYCLGGTLLSIAAARLAKLCDDCLKTVTLFAAQTDFTEAGELMLFINHSQVAWLEDMMWDQGYLDTRQMAGTFQLLRSNDLVWSTMVTAYLMGERRPLSDLMAWSTDATRMPQRMHSEYLRRLFLDNDLAAGRYDVAGEPVALRDIKLPVFAVSTTSDHIAPWKSVYKISWLTGSEVTFVLARGGHNAGIVSPPPSPDGRGNHREFRIGALRNADWRLTPDGWLAQAAHHKGSWWQAWGDWLAQNSAGDAAPPPMGSAAYPPLDAAPGTYVLEP
jgi:polyhydroxyalkanoate synthase